jgi:hypothetical protein
MFCLLSQLEGVGHIPRSAFLSIWMLSEISFLHLNPSAKEWDVTKRKTMKKTIGWSFDMWMRDWLQLVDNSPPIGKKLYSPNWTNENLLSENEIIF